MGLQGKHPRKVPSWLLAPLCRVLMTDEDGEKFHTKMQMLPETRRNRC